MLCSWDSSSCIKSILWIFEYAIRNAISIASDSNRIAATTGSIAGAFYDVPKKINEKSKSFLDKKFLDYCRWVW